MTTNRPTALLMSAFVALAALLFAVAAIPVLQTAAVLFA